MATRRPPKILLDTDPLSAEPAALPPAEEALLLPHAGASEPAAFDAASGDGFGSETLYAAAPAEAAEQVAHAFDERAAAAVETGVDAMADAAEAMQDAADPARTQARLDAALTVPRLMTGFFERQTRRTMDGAVGLARCRSLSDALALQGSFMRESVDDFVKANTDIAFRSLAVLSGQRTTVC